MGGDDCGREGEDGGREVGEELWKNVEMGRRKMWRDMIDAEGWGKRSLLERLCIIVREEMISKECGRISEESETEKGFAGKNVLNPGGGSLW